MDDILLIGKTLRGNTQAFRLLVLRYQKPLFKFLNGFALPDGRIEEIAQETFLRAYRNLASYQADKGASFITWLFVIAKRLAINELARSEHQYQPVQIEETPDIESETPTPLQHLESEQTQRRVQQALQQIEEPYRSALTLSYIDELKLNEIAEIEQCAIGTIKSRIYRGKQMLSRILARTMRTEI